MRTICYGIYALVENAAWAYGARAVRRARAARARKGFMRHQRAPGDGVVQRGRGQCGGCCAGTERCGRRCAPDAAQC